MNPKEVNLVGEKGDIIDVEVRIKRNKGQNRLSTNSESVQKTEKKGSNSKTKCTDKKWLDTFGKQSVESLKGTQSHKKDTKLPKSNNVNNKSQPKNKNLVDCSKQCCPSTILVHDSAVQCPDNISSFDKFGSHRINLVNVKEDEAYNFDTEEKLLPKKSLDSGKRLVTETKPEARAQSKEFIKKVKTNENWSAEKKELQRTIEKQNMQLKEISKEKAELKYNVRKLTQQLEEANSVAEDKSKTIDQQMEKIKTLETQIKTLEQQFENKKTTLNSKLQHLEETLIELEYTKAERDQYAKLSQYQDERIAKYQDTMRKLQNQIVAIANSNDGNASPQTSVTHTPGRATSSPTSSFSNCSDKSWHDLSDVSSVKQLHQSKTAQKNVAPLDVSLLDEVSSRSTTDSCQN